MRRHPARRSCKMAVLALVLLLASAAHASAQSVAPRAPVVLSDAPAELAAVDFLQSAPAIDGRLDAGLSALPQRTFAQVDFAGTDATPAPSHYRLAYGTDFFYVYVEARGETLAYNDRAYQNGDGFQVLIGRPMPGNQPTSEFYVAACSAVDRPEREWSRRIFWYFNVDKIFLPMSRQAKMESAARDGVISFELLIPWQDLHPYHPWLSEGIGFNIGFVKASGQGRLYYRVVPDQIGAEGRPRRYVPLRFAPPVLAAGIQTFSQVDRNHLRQSEVLSARSVTLAARDDAETLRFSVLSGEGTVLEQSSVQYACRPGLTRHESVVNLGALPPGGYRVAWASRRGSSQGDDSSRAAAVTLLSTANARLLAERMEAVARQVSPGSVATLQYLLQETQAALESMKPYETAAREGQAWSRVESDLAEAERGRDAVAARTGYFRRAFRSAIDGTLQPYAVRIPPAFDPKAGRKYPLIVFLHGSASDETTLAGADYLGTGQVIEMAPRGRGRSNAFTRDGAQEDIEEAIAAVMRDYPIDAGHIVLAGFSMGGYGVYRTYFEHPKRYRALAVFSGDPALPARWNDPSAPMFVDERSLARFKDVPLFIFHGGKDGNAPIGPTRLLVETLRGMGGRVEFVVEEETGHQAPNADTVRRFHDWLRRQLMSEDR